MTNTVVLPKRKRRPVDKTLPVIMTLLLMMGLVTLFSATYYNAQDGGDDDRGAARARAAGAGRGGGLGGGVRRGGSVGGVGDGIGVAVVAGRGGREGFVALALADAGGQGGQTIRLMAAQMRNAMECGRRIGKRGKCGDTGRNLPRSR